MGAWELNQGDPKLFCRPRQSPAISVIISLCFRVPFAVWKPRGIQSQPFDIDFPFFSQGPKKFTSYVLVLSAGFCPSKFGCSVPRKTGFELPTSF